MKIDIINGCNINFIGIRQTNIYGKKSYQELNNLILEESKRLNIDINIYQSNFEGDIINLIQNSYNKKVDGILINAGAFTHYSYGIRDALLSVNIPAIEIHISNTKKRDNFRKISVIEDICIGQIIGFEFYSYILGLKAIKNFLEN